MCVKLSPENLNLGPYPPHRTSTYTCGITIVPMVYDEETSKIYHQTIMSPYKYTWLLLLNESRSETETTSSCATETCIKICQINWCYGQVQLKSLLTRLIESTITGIGKVYEVELMKMLYLYLNKITFSSIKVACYCFFFFGCWRIRYTWWSSGRKRRKPYNLSQIIRGWDKNHMAARCLKSKSIPINETCCL